MDNRKVESVGLSKNLDVNDPFFQDLCKTYADYLNSSTTLINKKLAFYNSITYTVLESNQDSVRATNKLDPVLECPIYYIQKPEESRWVLTSINCTGLIKLIFRCDTDNSRFGMAVMLNCTWLPGFMSLISIAWKRIDNCKLRRKGFKHQVHFSRTPCLESEESILQEHHTDFFGSKKEKH
ncbi:hypothetical protein C2G38_2047880 [Gigaspora rosea]|uniref:Uncharacterized protein n=1 Tax=Gigaspora rosea TaxID=44941 RepID=A0A397UCM3_9GLOM|nr:hypothetical protein C2G38_2047880 [Gigaspora rosea]